MSIDLKEEEYIFLISLKKDFKLNWIETAIASLIYAMCEKIPEYGMVNFIKEFIDNPKKLIELAKFLDCSTESITFTVKQVNSKLNTQIPFN